MTKLDNHKAGFVAVIGRPNVGKSTLINSILEQKIAAVSPKPQTTRRQQLGILTLENAQIIFTDTPGIHEARHKLGSRMNDEAILALEDSDSILFMVDAAVPPHSEDRDIADLLHKLSQNVPVILALNKIDLINQETHNQRISEYQEMFPMAALLSISAATKDNLDTLIAEIIRTLPENPQFFDQDQITDLYERDIAADMIREAALIILHAEVPHGIAVRIDEYTERGNKGGYIEATIFVERESQKGIVVGEGGKMIKKVSTHARKEIEAMSGRKVFLRIRVKVRKNWRNDDSSLNLFGFQKKGRK